MLFKFIVTIHLVFWVYMLLGPFISPWHAGIILFWIIPIIWALHILPFHVLGQYEEKVIGAEDLPKREKSIILNKAVCEIYPFMKPWFFLQELGDDLCYANPIGGQGMLILSAIISSRILLNK